MLSYIKNKIRTLLNKKQRHIYFEKRRLYKIPRYQKGASSLTSPPFSFVDAATFLHGYEEIFESEIYKFNSINPKAEIIDCGSNIGLSVIYFKRLFPNAHLQAFEPDPEIAKVLNENITKFALTNVEIHNKAIWINNDGIEFQMEGGFSGRIPKPGDSNNIIRVPSKRLRDLLDKKIDFLKMDIEGAEYEVVFDCKDKLSNISNIFIEYHSHSKEDQNLHQILQFLHENNFRYHIHEAYIRRTPFVSKELMSGMDLQLNIYAIKL